MVRRGVTNNAGPAALVEERVMLHSVVAFCEALEGPEMLCLLKALVPQPDCSSVSLAALDIKPYQMATGETRV